MSFDIFKYKVTSETNKTLEKTFDQKWQAQNYLNQLEREWIIQGTKDAGKPLEQIDWSEARKNSDEFWEAHDIEEIDWSPTGPWSIQDDYI
jgi:hypothetical protein|tara:strand:+ start:232 stop:504 length:273 start_codon:yes stop_codon:yes gene_type:complete